MRCLVVPVVATPSCRTPDARRALDVNGICRFDETARELSERESLPGLRERFEEEQQPIALGGI